MCGIVGVFNFGSAPRDERDHVIRMRDAMVHRGPDDSGTHRLSPGPAVHRRTDALRTSVHGRTPSGRARGGTRAVLVVPPRG